jgi:hypothetical protein
MVCSIRKSVINILVPALCLGVGFTSCVPLAIGAAGAAAGYIARDEGVGVVEPAGSSRSGNNYDAYDPAVY